MTVRSVFQGQRGLILSIFAASMFVNLLILAAPLYMIQLFSRVMTSGSMPTLVALSVGVGIALVFFFAFDAIRQRLTTRLGIRLEANLGPAVMQGLIEDVPLREALGTQPVRDVQELRNFVSSSYFTALLDAPWSIVFVAVIFVFHVQLGIIALAGLAILFTLGILSETMARSPNKAATQSAQQVNRIADEVMRNADMVRAMGNTAALTGRWQRQSMMSMVFGALAADRVGLLTSTAKFFRMALQVAILGWGAVLVIQGEITAGLMMAASILLGRAAAPVEMSISGWRSLMSVRQSIQRLQAILDRRQSVEAQMELPEPVGRLSVEEATVILPDRQQPLLFGVSLDLKPGSSLGLIGPSGAGKTTLARALVGLQPLSRGHIRIDDAALTDWPAEQIGRYIGFLPQRVELFSGTVAENIAMMDEDAAPSAIVDAAKRAEVHDLILSMPQGYNTQVGAMGERLSAGQRQRIGLARAFYGDRRLIVLDEPNANLDPEGEEALARAVANATQSGAVVVVITHRMSILRRVSHAAVLDGGRLVRFGTAQEVFKAAVQPTAAKPDGAETVTVLKRPPAGAAAQAAGGV